MGDPFGLAAAKERQRELLREAEERRIARSLRKVRGGKDDHEGRVESESVEVSWGLDGDEPAVADLLELNGMPRWISFEERFVVAREDGKILGAVRYWSSIRGPAKSGWPTPCTVVRASWCVSSVSTRS